jgi:hypothetical protein
MKQVEQLMLKKPSARLKSQEHLTLKSQELGHHYFSKSYVYLTKGLSDEIENNNIEDSQIINYNSIFFEKDIDLEMYKQNIKDALSV